MSTIVHSAARRPMSPRVALRNYMIAALEHPVRKPARPAHEVEQEQTPLPGSPWLDDTGHWRFDPNPDDKPVVTGPVLDVAPQPTSPIVGSGWSEIELAHYSDI